MANQLEIRTTDPGFEKVQKDFDALPRSLKEIILRGSEVGQTYERMKGKARDAGQAGKEGMGELAKGAAGAIGALAGVGSVVGAITLSVGALRQEMEQLIDLQDKANKAQQKQGKGQGGWFVNDPTLVNNEKLFKAWDARGMQAIEKLGGEEAQDAVNQGIADLRSRTAAAGDAIPEELKMQAFGEAVELKQVDSSIDLGVTSAAMVNLAAQFLEKGQAANAQEAMRMASKVIRESGKQFAGNAAEIFSSVSALLGKTELGADPEEVFGVATTMSAGLNKSAETTAAAAGNLLLGLQTKPVKIGGKDVQLKGEGAAAKLLDFVARYEAGEFGTSAEEKAQAVAAVSGSQEVQTGLLQILKNPAQFRANIAAYRAARAGTMTTAEEVARIRRMSPQIDNRIRAMEGRGKAYVASISGPEGYEGAARESADDLEKRLGNTYMTPDGLRATWRAFYEQKIQGKDAADIERDRKTAAFRKALDRTMKARSQLPGSVAAREEIVKRLRAEGVPIEAEGGSWFIGNALEDYAKKYGVNAALSLSARAGIVTPQDGLSQFETEALAEAGVPRPELADLNRRYKTSYEDSAARDVAIQKIENLVQALTGGIRLAPETVQEIGQAVSDAARQQPSRPAADLPD